MNTSTIVGNVFRKAINDISAWSLWLMKYFVQDKSTVNPSETYKILSLCETMSFCYSFGILAAIPVIDLLKHQPYMLKKLLDLILYSGIFVTLLKMALLPELTITLILGWMSYFFLSVFFSIWFYFFLNINLTYICSSREYNRKYSIYGHHILTYFIILALDVIYPPLIIILILMLRTTVFNPDDNVDVNLPYVALNSRLDYETIRMNRSMRALGIVTVGASFLQHFLYLFLGNDNIFNMKNMLVSIVSSCIFGPQLFYLCNSNYRHHRTAIFIFLVLLVCLNSFSQAFGFLTVSILIYASMELVRTLYGMFAKENISPYYSLKYFLLVNFGLASFELAFRYLNVCFGFNIMNLLIKLLFGWFCTHKAVPRSSRLENQWRHVFTLRF
ncbi:hypothetical protein ENBRE01_1942 [Enteropsectra breve]|nr:hypothetical protein ENBRE01_1942 [Enteropsectra breve]